MSKIEPDNAALQFRQLRVFLILAGIFLGSLTMLNILGVSRFIDLSFELFGTNVPFIVAVGVLPYPITFLCTDFISELFGRRKANLVVLVGLLLNLWVLFVLWFGGWLGAPEHLNSEGVIPINELCNGTGNGASEFAFYQIRSLAFGATIASMLAYLIAQFVDVQIFHWLKKKTNGKKLWLRNNASTLISQLIDSIAVIVCTYYVDASALPMDSEHTVAMNLIGLILSGYVFKVVSALLDTVPFYLGTRWLKTYLRLEE